MSKGKISIITASYNYENFIKETIESVIAQTIQDWEMVIVDDGSTDNSINIIKEYCQKDSRIKLFTNFLIPFCCFLSSLDIIFIQYFLLKTSHNFFIFFNHMIISK